MVNNTFEGVLGVVGLLLLLLLEGGVPSSLEQACIIQATQVRVRPPVIWLINVLRFMQQQQLRNQKVWYPGKSFIL
jgi:hypothetical protein